LSKAKKASTRISLFYSKYPAFVNELDGNIHPQFNSTGTETRRPTGGSPNLLQLSKRGEGVKVRKCILPNKKKGHDLVCSIDWDGEELRVMAALSQDPNLLSCYVGDSLKDAHSIVAAAIDGVGYDEFMERKNSADADIAYAADNVRKLAKGVNFASAYGCGAKKLAQMILVDEESAASYLVAKKEAYSRLEEWKLEVIEDVKNKGVLSTAMGSKRHLYNEYAKWVGSSDSRAKSFMGGYERAGINFLVQGVCADYLKLVLSNLWKQQTFKRHNASLIAPIYDEIVFSCHHSQAESLISEIYQAMIIGIPNVDVPMLANPAVGVNFANQIEILKDCNETLTTELIQIAINKALGA
jgi:DNA polymerase-1